MNSHDRGRLRELARNVRAGRHETDAALCLEAAAELPALFEALEAAERKAAFASARLSFVESATGGAIEGGPTERKP